MLSQNVAKTTVPSYYMIRTNLPHRKPLNQWQPVYYFSGITKRDQRRIVLRHKRLQEVEKDRFDASCATALAQLEQWKSTTSRDMSASPLRPLALVRQLNAHGLVHLSAPIVDELHRSRRLTGGEYASLIRSLCADRCFAHVLRNAAQHDPALTYKLMADRQGSERSTEAYRIFDMAHTSLNALGKRGVSAAHYNALMEVLMSCGFSDVTRVASTVYDELGARHVAPTARTYELVMRSLALQGNTAEAESILNFMRNHHADEVSIDMMNSMILGHRENKSYDLCDGVWNELVDRRWPRANVLSAELYLRSIVDHSYTQNGSNAMTKSGRIQSVEKKKVPIVLTQMDTLGIPKISLSPPLLDEVEDALRCFAIHKSRFYEWGRAVKQFDFIEFRRRQGWLYGLDEVTVTNKMAPPARDPANPTATVGHAAAAELPAHFNERQPWMLSALEDTILHADTRERMDDVRAGDIFYDDRKSIHERSATWASEVPQTRYDPLYGMNNPDIPKVGIRRHLDVEYVNRQEVKDKDMQLVKKALSGGRRVRRKTEIASTHRNAADESTR